MNIGLEVKTFLYKLWNNTEWVLEESKPIRAYWLKQQDSSSLVFVAGHTLCDSNDLGLTWNDLLIINYLIICKYFDKKKILN